MYTSGLEKGQTITTSCQAHPSSGRQADVTPVFSLRRRARARIAAEHGWSGDQLNVCPAGRNFS